jgi:O-antigen ligase
VTLSEYLLPLLAASLIFGLTLIIVRPREGLFALIGLRLLFENPPFFHGIKTAMLTNAFGGFFLLLAIAWKLGRKDFVVFAKPVFFFFVFLLVASFSFLNINAGDEKFFLVVFLKYLSMPCMFILTYNTVNSEETGNKSLLYFALISIPPVIIGYLQLLFGTADHYSSFWGQRYDRIYSTFAHPNQFAFYLAVMLFALLSMFQRKVFPRLSLIYGGIVIVAILLTYSRAVWLCMGVCLAVFILFSPRLWAPAVVCCMCLVFLLSPIIRTGMKDTLDPNFGQRTSVDMRINITESLLKKAFLQKPLLGFGLGTSEKLVKEHTDYPELPPHNDYIRVLVEAGALGFAAFFIYLLSLVVLPFGRLGPFFTNRNVRLYHIMILFLAVIIAATNHLGNVSTMGMWFALLGIVYKLLKLDCENECV